MRPWPAWKGPSFPTRPVCKSTRLPPCGCAQGRVPHPHTGDGPVCGCVPEGAVWQWRQAGSVRSGSCFCESLVFLLKGQPRWDLQPMNLVKALSSDRWFSSTKLPLSALWFQLIITDHKSCLCCTPPRSPESWSPTCRDIYYKSEPLSRGWLGKNSEDFKTRMLQFKWFRAGWGQDGRSTGQGSEWDDTGDSPPVCWVGLAHPELSEGELLWLLQRPSPYCRAGELCSLFLRTGLPGKSCFCHILHSQKLI